MRAFAPMRPTFFNAPAPAIPTTMVEKTSGAMIDLMRLRKMSRRKKTAFPQSGRNQPTIAPTIKPIMICTVSDGRYHGRRRRFARERFVSSTDFTDFRRLKMNQESRKRGEVIWKPGNLDQRR